jgi:ERCC4-type nuclease
MAATNYTVIKDTREQQGWVFEPSKNCEGMIVDTLKTGDYTIVGYEKLLTIERKGSVSEFANNVTQARFERELERMLEYKYRYVVLEFDMPSMLIFPKNCGIPAFKQKFMKMTGYAVLAKMFEFQIKYNVQFIHAGFAGKDVATSIFKRVIENECKTL